MNNTKTRTFAMVALLTAATLVVGLTVAATAHSAYADYGKDDKKDKARDGGNENGNTVTILKADNKGSTSGFDTNVTQEAENTICTHPSGSCTVEGTPAAVSGDATDGSTSDGTDEDP
jgi:hypothetical protein